VRADAVGDEIGLAVDDGDLRVVDAEGFAQICAIVVSKPWPSEAPPVMTVTAPDGAMVTRTVSLGPSPVFSTKQPMPIPTASPLARRRSHSAFAASQPKRASDLSSRPI
jgi:hypothetical protein